MPHDDDEHEGMNGALQLVELPTDNAVKARRPLARLEIPRADPQSTATVKLVDAMTAMVTRINHIDHDLVEHGALTIDGFAKLDKRTEQRIGALQAAITKQLNDLHRKLFGSDGEIAIRARAESGHALEEVKDGLEDIKDAVDEIKTNPFMDMATGRPLTQADLDLRDAQRRAQDAETKLKAIEKRNEKRSDKWGNRTWQIALPIILAVLFGLERTIEAWLRGHW